MRALLPGSTITRDHAGTGTKSRQDFSTGTGGPGVYSLPGTLPARTRGTISSQKKIAKKKVAAAGPAEPSDSQVTANQLRKKAKSRRAAAVSRTHGLWVFKLALYH